MLQYLINLQFVLYQNLFVSKIEIRATTLTHHHAVTYYIDLCVTIEVRFFFSFLSLHFFFFLGFALFPVCTDCHSHNQQKKISFRFLVNITRILEELLSHRPHTN